MQATCTTARFRYAFTHAIRARIAIMNSVIAVHELGWFADVVWDMFASSREVRSNVDRYAGGYGDVAASICVALDLTWVEVQECGPQIK